MSERTVTPNDIMEIEHPIVKELVQKWRDGQITWGTALMSAVLHLSREVKHLKGTTFQLKTSQLTPLVEAAQEAIKLSEPIQIVPPLDPKRIQFFKDHGHWPEGLPETPRRYA